MPKTIMMIHGMWGGPWYWDKFKNYFSEIGYHCINATLRHHDVDPNDEPNPALGHTGLLEYAADLENEISKLDEKPILFGHSMGGLLAMILAGRNQADAVVALTPAAPAGVNSITPSVIRSFFSVQTKWAFWKKPMRQTYGEAVYSMLNLLPPNEQKEAYSNFVYESGRAAFQIGYWFLDSQKASRVDIDSISRPLLIIGGKKDRITPISVIRSTAKKFEGKADFREFDNQAHWIIAEPGWQEVADYVASWLDEKLDS
jgi:pimeloyl-ACP methyl ester carboxylesterase